MLNLRLSGMTHLCHKPVGGGAEIPQCSSLSGAPTGLAVLFSFDRAPSHGPRMGGTDEDLPSTARIHRRTRRRGGSGVAARGARSNRSECGVSACSTGATKTIPFCCAPTR
jgi:hypothetical protein